MKWYLLERPFSSKDFKVTFNHVKFNITPQSLTTQLTRNALQSILITIYDSFSVEFQPECQVLLSNLFKIIQLIVSNSLS